MKLFYRKYGTGPPLVILHGLYGSSDNWVSIARKICTHFTVYLPDQRNHGLSPHSELHDYETMSSDLFELVSEFISGKFILAGHSMGGKTAIRFAIRWPELLAGLLVADISPFETKTSNPESYNQHLNILRILSETDISKISSRKELEMLFADQLNSGRIRALIMKNIYRMENGNFAWKINNASLLKNFDSIIGSVIDPGEISEPVTGFPVIFLKGEHSDYLSEEKFADILNLFPAAELKIIKNAGHWIHADNPEAVIREIINFGTI